MMELWIMVLGSLIILSLVMLLFPPKKASRKKWALRLLFHSGQASVIVGVGLLVALYIFKVWNDGTWALACGAIFVSFGIFLLKEYRNLNYRGYD